MAKIELERRIDVLPWDLDLSAVVDYNIDGTT
jgi:hypothetical protein